MSRAHISLNQLAEFSGATKAAKARIIRQQIQVNKFLIPWYQAAKGGIKKYLKNVNDFGPLDAMIEALKKKPALNDRQKSDRRVSIEALQRMARIEIANTLGSLNYEFIIPDDRSIVFEDITIGISPDIIIKTIISGKVIYGGVKIHISKNKPFDQRQCNCVAKILRKYIATITKAPDSVLPRYCLCIDVFSGRVVSAQDPYIRDFEIKAICQEIKTLWDIESSNLAT